MRLAFAGMALLALLLLLPGQALAATERLTVHVGYPTPGTEVVVYQQPGCQTHALLWEGAWFTAADAATWAWDGSDLATADQLTHRARDAGGRLLALTVQAASGAAEGWEAWWENPLDAGDWGLGFVQGEDDCALRAAEVTTGLSAVDTPP